MFGFLKPGLFPVKAYLRITLAVSDSAHGKIHADLRTLALEIGPEPFDYLITNFLRDIIAEDLAYTNNMLGCPYHICSLLCKSGGWRLAYGALLGRGIRLMNITANLANPFFHFLKSP